MLSRRALVGFLSCRNTASSASAITKRKRFYKEVGLVDEVENGGSRMFKVTLDGRILKTQKGQVLKLDSEPLALAIAEEWSSQEEFIHIGHMRMTGLAFTALDNPFHNTKETLSEKIMEYLETDTILYWNTENEKIHRYQIEQWKPVIEHANSNLGTKIAPCESIFDHNFLKPSDRNAVHKWLLSHNFWSLTGLLYGVETVKSVLLPYNVLTYNISAEEAVTLANLEQRAQAETWGTVEWAHGIEEQDSISRLAASSLFVYFSSNNHSSQELRENAK